MRVVVNIHVSCVQPSPRKCGLLRGLAVSSQLTKPARRGGGAGRGGGGGGRGGAKNPGAADGEPAAEGSGRGGSPHDAGQFLAVEAMLHGVLVGGEPLVVEALEGLLP